MKPAIFDPVPCKRRDPCLVSTLNAPGKRNVPRPQMYEVLHSGLDGALADPEIARVMLTGAGGYSCANGDLNALAYESGNANRGAMSASKSLGAITRPVLLAEIIGQIDAEMIDALDRAGEMERV